MTSKRSFFLRLDQNWGNILGPQLRSNILSFHTPSSLIDSRYKSDSARSCVIPIVQCVGSIRTATLYVLDAPTILKCKPPRPRAPTRVRKVRASPLSLFLLLSIFHLLTETSWPTEDHTTLPHSSSSTDADLTRKPRLVTSYQLAKVNPLKPPCLHVKSISGQAASVRPAIPTKHSSPLPTVDRGFPPASKKKALLLWTRGLDVQIDF